MESDLWIIHSWVQHTDNLNAHAIVHQYEIAQLKNQGLHCKSLPLRVLA